ncbi:MAG: ABC transporter substrate-binding protein, partial [Planctomycetes bacterium]|nr:ABC transporter substrate-binding protein [Planctomycetota bacterium]
HEYNLTVLLDSARNEPYAQQYCCAAYVSAELVATNPDAAARFTRAMQQASAWIQANPDETTHIQVDNNYVAGDPELNASILKTYNYIPSVKGAYDAFEITAVELQNIGILPAEVDIDFLRENSFAFFSDVADTVSVP